MKRTIILSCIFLMVIAVTPFAFAEETAAEPTQNAPAVGPSTAPLVVAPIEQILPSGSTGVTCPGDEFGIVVPTFECSEDLCADGVCGPQGGVVSRWEHVGRGCYCECCPA